MSNRIAYTQAGNTGKALAQAVNDTLVALANVRRIKALLDRAQYGAPATWADVAAELGLPATQAGEDQAQAAWSIIGAALERLDHDAIRVELARLDQG